MNTITVAPAPKISKKDARRIIYEKLAGALAEYKSNLKEKRFDANLKKASNLFAGDLVKAMKKKNRKPKGKAAKAKKEVNTTNGIVV